MFGFADTINCEKKQKGDELFFKYCPYCHGGNHDEWTFSINLDSGAFKCFRASCGKSGHFVELARDMRYTLDFGNETKKFRKLPQLNIRSKSAAINYLESRGISEEITRKYKITICKNDPNTLVFPFYDENNNLIFVKYRNIKHNGTGSKEWCEENTKPILFGMAQCTNIDRLIITEGQIDSLSVAQCGFENAVSVPTGALGFTWLPNVWDWIIKFSEIIVFGDWEKGKMSLLSELQNRIPVKIKAVRKEDYLGEKDANDILRKYGKQAICTAIENAVVPPVEHVKQLADVKTVDLNSLPKIKTNIPEIDRLIGGFYFGQVVLLTGRRGEGKSTFLSQMVAETIEQDYPSFVYSGELTDYHFKRWLDFQLTGPEHIRVQYDGFHNEIYTIPDDVIEKINNWYRDKVYLYDNNYIEDDELCSLTDTIEQSVRQYGVKVVFIDNLMTALDVGLNDDLYRAQSKFVKNLKQIAMKYEIVVMLVAHPRKTNQSVTADDVSGSGDITNRVDLVLNYARNNDKNIDCDGTISIIKNRLTGVITGNDKIELFYSKSTKRITSVSNIKRKYGWENEKSEPETIELLPFE